jgi:hypothetical protein
MNTHGLIWRWRKTLQNREQFNLEKLVTWSSYHKWAGCIIAMSEEPPESALMVSDRFPFTTEEHGVAVVGHLYYCLKLFETSSLGACGDDQEDRFGILNRWRSQSC